MPTPTEYFGYSVTNIGPLTTRFTPAPSCATTTPNVYIETELGDARGLYGFPSCSFPKYEGCLPNGKEFDELNRQLSATPHNGNLVYHSPGLKCPSGWKRVGTVHGGTKQPTRPEGAFTEITSASSSPNGVPEPIPRLEAYANVLDPTETSGLVVVSAIPVVALVYRQEDRQGGLNSTNTSEIDDSASMRLKPNVVAIALGAALASWAVATII
ncbi:hypothetical protein MHUMG1_02304 [Metarhizium humberi]|uniref:Uncharacterized protein n=1 Tax=Metarhizium humberi TaxID=2596975 RepID=A0A9P8MDI4_9HYPO|nr:hypothetical protein MHUMG1_02304 [Metarhizium humberi]